MFSYPVPWREAWVNAAYGRAGFWTRERPGRHFRTSSATGSLLAHALARLLSVHREVEAVLELGAGDGQLLEALQPLRPDLRLIGSDLRARPAALSSEIEWCVDRWDVLASRWSSDAIPGVYVGLRVPALVVAVEWLDDLPCPIAEATAGGWRNLEVWPDGTERHGLPLGADDEAWVRRWWPSGTRVEVGSARDIAWANALAALPHGGLGLMIDYGHTANTRPRRGTLAGYRDGRRLQPYPDGRSNLTAHVAVDAVAEAGRSVGATTLWLERQCRALDRLAAAASRPPPPVPVLARLEQRSQSHALRAAGGLGDHWWLLQRYSGAVT